MLITGVVSPPDALGVLQANVNILLFFLGLMLVTLIAEMGGFFDWSAARAVSLADGNGYKLLGVVFALGAVVTFFFSNDATALVLTPIVFMLVTRLKVSPLPFVFACAFVANTASLLLPVSNPVNLLAVDRFRLELGEYLRYLLVPTVLALLVNFGLFAVIFRKQIPRTFAAAQTQPFRTDGFFHFVCAGVALTAAGYVLALVYRMPVAVPAMGGAIFLVAGTLGFRRAKPVKIARGLQWSILLFIFSLALMVKGLDNAGVTQAIGDGLENLAGRGTFAAVMATTFLTAFGSNIINNWSMMMVSVSSLGSIGNPSAPRPLVYSSILGADLGPNIAILGSLSSMLWLVLLRRRGLDIRPLDYLKLGLLVTPPMLALGALGIYLASPRG